VASAGGPSDADDYDQNIVLDPARRMLFVANGGSDTISAFRVGEDGSLQVIAGSPFSSGGHQPVSIGLAGDNVYVVNKDRDPGRPQNGSTPNYAGFRISGDGTLSPMEQAIHPAPMSSSPTQALVSRDGLVFGAEILGGVIRSFRMNSDGSLATAGTAHPAVGPPGPIGLAAHPTRRLLYVGLPAIHAVGVYSFDDEGVPSQVATATSSGRATCWLVVNGQGTHLYAANNADNSVSVFDLADPAAPLERQHVALAGGSAAYQIILDPGETALYAISTNAASGRAEDNVIHRLSIQPDGTLVEPGPATPLPVAAQAHPAGIAIFSMNEA
jgi:6-phosphogluconolactonase (cycloisomerase 2 family)